MRAKNLAEIHPYLCVCMFLIAVKATLKVLNMALYEGIGSTSSYQHLRDNMQRMPQDGQGCIGCAEWRKLFTLSFLVLSCRIMIENCFHINTGLFCHKLPVHWYLLMKTTAVVDLAFSSLGSLRRQGWYLRGNHLYPNA